MHAAVLSLDEAVFSDPNYISTLQRSIVPTEDERAKLQPYLTDECDPKSLGATEALLLLMASVPRLQQRLECLGTKLSLHPRLRELDAQVVAAAPRRRASPRIAGHLASPPRIDCRFGECDGRPAWPPARRPSATPISRRGLRQISALDAALAAVHASKALPLLLSFVLSIGNVLNAGTAKGDAAGFRLEDLQKLADVKTTSEPQAVFHCPSVTLHDLPRPSTTFQVSRRRACSASSPSSRPAPTKTSAGSCTTSSAPLPRCAHCGCLPRCSPASYSQLGPCSPASPSTGARAPIHSSYSHLLFTAAPLPPPPQVRELKFESLREKMVELRAELEMMGRELTSFEPAAESDRFAEVIRPFYSEAASHEARLEARLEATNAVLVDLSRYLADKVEATEPEAVLARLHAFETSFGKACRDNERQANLERAKAIELKAAEERRKSAGNTPGGTPGSGGTMSKRKQPIRRVVQAGGALMAGIQGSLRRGDFQKMVALRNQHLALRRHSIVGSPHDDD